MGSVYKRGNRYWIKYRDRRTEKLVRRSAGFTRLDALAALQKIAAKEEKVEGESGEILFEVVWNDYFANLRTRAKAWSICGASSVSARVLDFFSGKDVRELNLRDINAFIQHRQKQGVKSKTINNDLAYIRAALRYAVENGLLETLPLKVKLLRAPKKRVLPILSPEEILRLLEHAQDPYRGILLVCAHTGFRLGETLHLTWEDVFWTEGKLAIRAKHGWEAKSYEERAVFVTKAVVNYLRRLRLKSPFKGPKDYIFTTRNGTPIQENNACRAFRHIFKQADLYQKGFPLTHWIRHSVCSRLLGQGIDVETVRQLMGHSEASTTLLYAHSSNERMKRASQLLALE